MELVAFLWVVGWLYACGVISNRMDDGRLDGIKYAKPFLYLSAIILWPFFISYSK